VAYWVALLALASGSFGDAVDQPLTYLIGLGAPLAIFAGLGLWRAGRLGLSHLAYRDDLTGAANRRAFLLRARHLLPRAKLGTLALILLDVDDLKDINDDCGHQAGDELLIAVADRLGKTKQTVYRIGGDEFAILVDRADGQSVTSLLPHLEPFDHAFSTCGHRHGIALSYGCASNEEGDSFDSLFRRADIGLRQYKRRRHSPDELAAEKGGPHDAEATVIAASPITSLADRRRERRRSSV
jgi:diguanylate cyclase (GGDEF)-like protein